MVPARNRRIDLNNHAVKIQTLALIRKTQFAAESDAPSGYKENTLIRRGRSPWVGTNSVGWVSIVPLSREGVRPSTIGAT
jgi:hypothetical protein